MLAALSLGEFSGRKLKILVCGTGAGVLPMFLRNHLGEHVDSIQCIDNNKHLVETCSKYFGFKPDGVIESLIGDAHEHVKKCESGKFDLILVDVSHPTEETI